MNQTPTAAPARDNFKTVIVTCALAVMMLVAFLAGVIVDHTNGQHEAWTDGYFDGQKSVKRVNEDTLARANRKPFTVNCASFGTVPVKVDYVTCESAEDPACWQRYGK